MLALISQREVVNGFGRRVDVLEQNYIQFLDKFRIKLIPVSNSFTDLNDYFELPIDLIILSGGNNVDPSLYDKEIGEVSDVSVNRDNVERKLLEFAISKKIPVFCICRGAQFLNVFFGGKLIRVKNHVGVKHKVRVDLFDNDFFVNSFHHYGLDALSPKLKPFAIAGDGTIEGFYHPDYYMAGIIWHPERLGGDDDFNFKLLDAFLKKELFWKK